MRLLILSSLYLSSAAAGQSTERLSVTASGGEMNGICSTPSISADGSCVAFCTTWTLAADDLNCFMDVYVRDLRTGVTTLESKSTSGVCGNDESGTELWGDLFVAPSLSADGRYVAFYSKASNLVSGDTEGNRDVFVRDRVSGTTTRASVSSIGAPGDEWSLVPVISADGRFVAFQSLAGNLGGPERYGFWDVFRHDMWTGRTVKLSLALDGTDGNGSSGGDEPIPVQGVAISADGRWVAFESTANNLVPGGITMYFGQIYVRDCLDEHTYLVGASAAGVEANHACRRPSISGDGRYIAFESAASNLVSGDTNQSRDVFVKDMVTGAVHRASVSATGAQGDSESLLASITPDGRYVGFFSQASNLDPIDGDGLAGSFVHDTWTGVTSLVCLSSFGVKSNNHSGPARLSADGQTVAFDSGGTNLVLDDTHVNWDVFVHHMPPRGSSVVSYCRSTPNSTGQNARIEYTGAFQLSAGNLELHAAHCPPSRLGLFIYGDARAHLPFGAGWRCVGGSLHRLPLVQTTTSGRAQFALGPLLGSGSTGIQPGSTWNFQFAFRDATGGPAPEFNLSDAMSATFAP